MLLEANGIGNDAVFRRGHRLLISCLLGLIVREPLCGCRARSDFQ